MFFLSLRTLSLIEFEKKELLQKDSLEKIDNDKSSINSLEASILFFKISITGFNNFLFSLDKL